MRHFLYILFVAVLIQGTVFSQQYWIQKPCPTTCFLRNIIFVDTVYGWASGDSGTVIHTTNSGDSWFVQSQLSTWSVTSIDFINRDTGWVLINTYSYGGTTFLKTTNSGYNWYSVPIPDTTILFNLIIFPDTYRGFLAGEGNRPYRTTDGGSSWQRCQSDSNAFAGVPIQMIRFYDSLTGYACGGAFDRGGVVWHTTDGGSSWVTKSVSPEPVFDLKIISPTSLFAVGGGFDNPGLCGVYYSSNGGGSWSFQNISCGSFSGVLRAVAFRTPSEVWVPLAPSATSAWVMSLDTGIERTWTCIYNSDSVSMYDAVFVTPTFGWAAGNKTNYYNYTGALMKYNSAIIGIHGFSSVPGIFSLSQNYPNPFNPVTTVKYEIPSRSFVTLRIFDLLGRLVATLVSEEENAGSYEAGFDGSNMASGVYICRMEARNSHVDSPEFIQTRKMVLLK